jgi:hypothetical protein
MRERREEGIGVEEKEQWRRLGREERRQEGKGTRTRAESILCVQLWLGMGRGWGTRRCGLRYGIQ